MSQTTTTISDFLAQIEPFGDLSPQALAEFARRLQPLRYRMGQTIMVRSKMPKRVAILYQGQARWLGYDPRTNVPVTLARLEPGAILGKVNWMRGIPCETAIASTEVVCLTMSVSDWEQFLDRTPSLEAALSQRPSLLEVFDLLGHQLEQQAQGEGNLKELAFEALETAQVHLLPPGQHTQAPERASADRVWLVSGGSEVADYPVGSQLEFTHPVTVQGAKPARLVGIPRRCLSLTEETGPDERHRPAASATLEEVPYAEAELLGEEPPQGRESSHYPFIRGKSPLDAGVACFQMLSQYFGMPFRKDVIRRVLADQLSRIGSLSLNVCGAVAELMGLTAQLVTVPANALPRLQTPALVRWQDSLAIIYEVNAQQIVIGVPEIGLLKRQLADFVETWSDDGQVLLLKPTKETPKERFGLRWFLPSLVRYRRVLLEVFVASFFVQLFGLANPLMIQVIIDKVIVQNSPDTLQVLGIFLLVIAVFEAFLSTLRTYLFVDTTNRIDMNLGSEIIDHLLRLPLRYFERRPVGEIATRVGELENIRQFLTGTALTVVLDTVFSVVYIVVMVIYSPLLTLVALGIIPIFIGLTLFFSPTIRRQLRTKAERNAQTQSYLVEVMSGIGTVKAQNIELRSRWQWQERYARYVSAGFNTVVTSTIASSASNFLNKFSGLLVLWVGASLVLQGELSLGQLIAFRIIASYVTSPMLRLAQLWQNFQETALSLERLGDIVDTPQEAEEDRYNIPMPQIIGAVKYENVSFRFKNSGPLQLNNVSLDFPPGTFVGVVGRSGAGKSTLTKLISRLYEPEGGRILVDGYDINKVELYSLRRQIGVVPQEPLLFDGTVQENIALTNPDASTEDVIQAAQTAAAHEFIMNLPNGYNTRVGERGSALSGGQRQRIAIARTILQQPNVLVLDEATSALDYATEQEVCLNLQEAFANRTVFFITHRLGTVKQADVIVMMEAGAVVEQGSHEQLMAKAGHYYYLYQQQESRL
ncbi:MAG: peptidase domain-containing ABC transporter [Cyanophyceae cyanobacterium]